MPQVHTVVQGETLTRIARKYKFSSWKMLYDHPDNAPFRALRDNPNIICPGDTLVIPDKEPRFMCIASGKSHTFILKREREVFKMKLLNSRGKVWQGRRAVLTVGDQTVDGEINDQGIIELPLKQGNETEGTLEVYLNPKSDQPTHKVTVKIGHLDPVDTLKGVQERCNQLGFPCGFADGIMGSKTRSGVQAFQQTHGLEVDGIPGPQTKAKLKDVFGM